MRVISPTPILYYDIDLKYSSTINSNLTHSIQYYESNVTYSTLE